MENTDTIYDELKTSVRLLKGSIVEGCKKDNQENEDVNYVDNRRNGRTQ